MYHKRQVSCAIVLISASALLLVASMIVSINHASILFGVAAIAAATGTLVLLWAAHRNLRYVAVYLASIVLSVLLAGISMIILDEISISKHGDIGVGGGFSIAFGSVFSSAALGLALLISTGLMQLRAGSDDTATWPIGLAHYISLSVWLGILSVFGYAI